MHIITLVETDPRNFQAFEDWINSLDYGSRAYCRELRLYDINIKKENLDKLLGDLKHYDKSEIAGEKGSGRFFRLYVNFLKFFNKILPFHPIDMNKVKKSEDFKPIEFPKKVRKSGAMKNCGTWLYLKPLGYFKDKFRNGHESI